MEYVVDNGDGRPPNVTAITMKPCKDKDNMMCYDDFKKDDPKLDQLGALNGDYFASKKKSTMKFSLRKCVNSTTNICASDDDMKEFFKKNFLSYIKYKENYVAISNSTEPLAFAKKAEPIEIDPQGYKTVLFMYVSHI